MPKIEGFEFDVVMFGKAHRCKFLTRDYTFGGRLAIRIVTVLDEYPFADLTVNLIEKPLEKNEIFVKTWSENEVIAKACMATGLFEDTGKRVPTGFVQAQVWRIKEGGV
jgi:hypothetical protein